MASDEIERLTYRELAERLGIKVHAARMRASREAAKGRWRVVRGNHPNDTAHVEIPASDLTRAPRVTMGTVPPSRAEGNRDSQASDALALAQARIVELTDRLLVEIEARQQDRENVAAGIARERMLEGEIIRLGDNVAALTAALGRARLPWWRR